MVEGLTGTTSSHTTDPKEHFPKESAGDQSGKSEKIAVTDLCVTQQNVAMLFLGTGVSLKQQVLKEHEHVKVLA